MFWMNPNKSKENGELRSIRGLCFINTVTYNWPASVAGTTVAPTANQARLAQQVAATITGDGAATSFTVTHNWGLSAGQLASGVFPEVTFEILLAAGYTAAPLVGSKTANAIAFTNTAFTGAGLLVRVKRPLSTTK